MTTFETWTLALQGAASVAGLATLAFLFFQMRAMSVQILAAQDATRTQVTLQLVDFLQAKEAREARECVRRVLSEKKHVEWNDVEKTHASLVCSNYDVVACLLRSNLSHVALFTENWGVSILHCHEILSPFMVALRQQKGGSASYWSNFDWLQKEVERLSNESKSV